MLAPAAPRAGVRQQDHPQDGYGAGAGAQELFQQVGRLVQLNAGRSAAAVGDVAALDKVAEPVEFLKAPGITVAVDGRVEVLALDRDEPRGPQQQVVDLAPPVAVAAEQDPVVAKRLAELPDNLLLASDPGGEPGFHVRRRRDAAAPCRSRGRGRRRQPSELQDRDRGTQPGDPVLAGAGAITRVRRSPEQ